MRDLLHLACRAFPSTYRVYREEELVDTAVLASGGSRSRALREAGSLVLAGLRERAHSHTTAKETSRIGAARLAAVLALVNLAVAVAGITAAVQVHGLGLTYVGGYGPYVVDGWWIAFTAVAAVLAVAIVLGRRAWAVWAAIANLVLVAYDALFLANGSPYDGRGHLDVFTYTQTSSYPGGRQWLGAAILIVAAAVASGPALRAWPRRALSTPLALGTVLLLLVLSRNIWGAFLFLRWPLIAVGLLALLLAAVAPWLAVVASGATLAALPSAIAYLTAPNLQHEAAVTAVVAAALAVGVLLPLRPFVRRRLT